MIIFIFLFFFLLSFLSVASAPSSNTVPSLIIPAPEPAPIQYTDPWADIPGPSPPDPLLEQKGVLRNPGGYVEGECELAARDWQREYGGELVFIAPFDNDTGAWIKGEFVGAWVNKKGTVYYDYFNQMTFPTKEGLIRFYEPSLSQKLGRNAGAKVYVQGIDTMPYGIKYHYS